MPLERVSTAKRTRLHTRQSSRAVASTDDNDLQDVKITPTRRSRAHTRVTVTEGKEILLESKQITVTKDPKGKGPVYVRDLVLKSAEVYKKQGLTKITPPLSEPRTPPKEWQAVYDRLKIMRSEGGIAWNAPVDGMGCASLGSPEFTNDAKVRMPSQASLSAALNV